MTRSIESLEGRRLLSGLTVNFAALGGPLQRPGLGSLFGVTALAGGSDPGLTHASTVLNSAPADVAGVKSGNPFSFLNVVPILRAAGTKTVVRYADMLSGFPYQWTTLATWDADVTGITRVISASDKDVVAAVAPLNEPDDSLAGNFSTDPAIPAGTYDQRVNFVWQHTVKEIRAIDPAIPILGPNYLSYYPQSRSADQPRMTAFLQNAIATNTVPDYMAWHLLLTNSPADYGIALNNYYRPLEASLGLPRLPLICEEYGINNGSYAGIPSALVPYWAEFARDGVAYASAGVYDNGGTLGNEVRHFDEPKQQPNAGWWAADWYHDMAGVVAPVTSAGAYDGVASYDATHRTAAVLLAGGTTTQATVSLAGLGGLLGTNVRVQLKDVVWTADVNEPNATLEHGGDPVVAPTTVLDQTYAANAAGTVTVNFHLQNLAAYEIVVTPAAATPTTRYEAEAATITDAPVHAAAADSGGAYVGPLANADAAVTFAVAVPAAGLYDLGIRYAAANPSPDTQTVAVNGVAQGTVTYPQTAAPAAVAVARADKYVVLRSGSNTVRLGFGAGAVELDAVDVMAAGANGPAVYEAETALTTDTTPHAGSDSAQASGGGYVGGINNADSTVAFTVIVPSAGPYDLTVAYGAAAAATHTLAVNGVAQPAVRYPATGGYLNTTEGTVDVTATLVAGVNTVTLGHAAGFAELDFLAAAAAAGVYPVQYEAEAATVTAGTVYAGSPIASGGSYVGNLVNADSAVAFAVAVPATGLYDVTVRYAANAAAATQSVVVNGVSQGAVAYPATAGSSTADLLTAVKLVALRAGSNTITFGKGIAAAELDEVGVEPDTHRYEAETATITDASAGHYPYAYTFPFTDFVGGINAADAGVSFAVAVPVAGTYDLAVAYGNGSGTTSTYTLTVDGTAGMAVSLPATAGYLGSVASAGQNVVTVPVSLAAGSNTIALGKGTSYAELNDVRLTYTAAPAVTFAGPNEYLRLDADGATLDVWYDTAANGPPAYAVPLAAVASINIAPTAAGTGTVTVDFSAGTPLPAGGLSVNAGGGSTRLTLAVVGTPAADAINVTAATVAFAGRPTINYAGLAAITINGDVGSDAIAQLAQPGNGATLALVGNTAADRLNVTGGTFTFPAPIAGGGVAVYPLSTLTVIGGARAVLPSAAAPADRLVLRVASLTGGGTTDVGRNDLDLTGTTIAAVTALAAAGYAGGTWAGSSGLTSSAAAADPAHLTAVGVIGNAAPGSTTPLYPTFDGQAAAATDVLVRYAVYGDANLDGVVNGADYVRVDAGYAQYLTGWANGDFNYDGKVDGSDYTLIDNAFDLQSVGLVAAPAAVSAAATPSSAVEEMTTSSPTARPTALPPPPQAATHAATDGDDARRRSRPLSAGIDSLK